MPEPISICLEDLGARGFTRCVAVSGALPGLRLGVAGEILWLEPGACACELWVSADERLVLLRPEGSPPVALERGPRRLEVPGNKPVIVLDGDEVEAGGRRFRVHVHGLAPAVVPPERLALDAPAGRLAGAAAAVALGAALVGCPTPPDPPQPGTGGKTPPIEVRQNPPAPVATPPVKDPPPAEPKTPPIELREQPPKPAPPRTPSETKPAENK